MTYESLQRKHKELVGALQKNMDENGTMMEGQELLAMIMDVEEELDHIEALMEINEEDAE